MEDYEIAVRKWAEERLRLANLFPETATDWTSIERVAFATNAGWRGSDVTSGDLGTAAIEVKFFDQHWPLQLEDMMGPTMYDEKRLAFDDLLSQVLAIEITDEDRARGRL